MDNIFLALSFAFTDLRNILFWLAKLLTTISFSSPKLAATTNKPFGTELLLYLFKLNPTGTKFSIILPGPPIDFGTK